MPIKPDPKNARLHPARNKEMIRGSLKEVGGGRSILVDGDGIIRAGNGVYEEAQALGMTVREVEAKPNELIAVVRPDLKGDRAIRAAILDNRTAETSEWNADVLLWMEQTQPDMVANLWSADEWRKVEIAMSLPIVDDGEIAHHDGRVVVGTHTIIGFGRFAALVQAADNERLVDKIKPFWGDTPDVAIPKIAAFLEAYLDNMAEDKMDEPDEGADPA